MKERGYRVSLASSHGHLRNLTVVATWDPSLKASLFGRHQTMLIPLKKRSFVSVLSCAAQFRQQAQQHIVPTLRLKRHFKPQATTHPLLQSFFSGS